MTENPKCPICGARMYRSFDGYFCPPDGGCSLGNSKKGEGYANERARLLHCQHCEDSGGTGCEGWDHHCLMEGSGYIKWNDGECPLCFAALTERAAIVAWLRDSGAVEDDAVADAVEAIGNSIEIGDHLRGNNE